MEEGIFPNSLSRDPNMDPELRVATLKGNVPSLLELLAKEKLLLEKFTSKNDQETPLHIAAMLGHSEFAIEILAQEAELAKKQDSQGSTPLHLAAAKGHFNIVVSLLTVNPDLCSFCDKEKRNPLHVAAIKGHVDVLEFLVRAKPDVARDKVKNGQTMLHLCVKHDRLEALKLLIDILSDDEFINSRDEDGNTILHLAATDRQTKTIIFLIDKGVNPTITNSRGFTALDLLAHGESKGRALEIGDCIPQNPENHDPANNTVTTDHPPVEEVNETERKRKWQNSMHKTLMVVAALLATMAFQTSITPPGGLWQDDFLGDKNNSAHFAGESIMANAYPHAYKYFLACNTISFVASLSIIMLLISGLPLKRRRITTWIAMLTMWVAVTFTAATYAISIIIFTPYEESNAASKTLMRAMLAWAALMALIFLSHIIRLFLKLVRKISKLVHKTSTRWGPKSVVARSLDIAKKCLSQKRCPEPQGHSRGGAIQHV